MTNDINENRLIELFKATNKLNKYINTDCLTAFNSILEELQKTLYISKAYIFKASEYSNEFYLFNMVDSFNDFKKNNEFDVLSKLPNSFDKLKDGIPLIISDIITLDIDQCLATYFHKEQIKSIVLFPICYGNKLKAYIRLDECFDIKIWSQYELLYVESAAEIIKNILHKKNEENKFNSRDFERLMNSISEATVIFDLDGTIRKVNSAFSNKFEKTPDEMLNTNVWSYYSQSVFEKRATVIKKMLGSGKPTIGEDINEGRWNNYRLFPIKNEENKIVQIAEFSKDVTRLMNAFTELKLSREIYMTLFNNMKCCAIVLQATDDCKNFIIKDFNKSAEKLEKMKREKIIGRKVTDIFPGLKKFGIFDVLKRVYETGIPEDFPLAFYQDKRISGWRDNYVFKLASGEIVATYFDQTDLKVIEADLVESKKHLELAIKGTGAGIWEWDIKNDIFNCNDKWWDIIGYEPDENGIITKERWAKICHPLDLKYMTERLKNHLAGKSSMYQCEIRLKHKKGHWILVLDTGSIVERSKDNKPLFMAGTHLDISELKKTQSENVELKKT